MQEMRSDNCDTLKAESLWILQKKISNPNLNMKMWSRDCDRRNVALLRRKLGPGLHLFDFSNWKWTAAARRRVGRQSVGPNIQIFIRRLLKLNKHNQSSFNFHLICITIDWKFDQLPNSKKFKSLTICRPISLFERQNEENATSGQLLHPVTGCCSGWRGSTEDRCICYLRWWRWWRCLSLEGLEIILTAPVCVFEVRTLKVKLISVTADLSTFIKSHTSPTQVPHKSHTSPTN